MRIRVRSRVRTMREEVLLVRVGEIHLKGLNRPYFMSQLLRLINVAVKPLGGRAVHSEGRVYVHGLSDVRAGAQRVCRVFGVHSVSPALAVPKDFPSVCEAALELMRPLCGTFKVDARRGDKRYPMQSPQIASELGAHVLSHLPGLQVSMREPNHLLQVEIRDVAYLMVEVLPAAGGMPVGTNGRALCLLSGGIDSPVAAYHIMRRGVLVDMIHFHAFPYTSERALQKVRDLAGVLARYCGPVNLYVVPFTDAQLAIRDKCPEPHMTLIMRRLMMRIAQRVAENAGALALVTGESIGQVASQTMQALACTNAVVSMPVLRPLIGADKLDIIRQAQALDTFAISTLPYEDCCTVFTPRHPTTRPQIESLERDEQALPMAALIDQAVAGITLESIGPAE